MNSATGQIGIGVGALIINERNQVLLMKRGSKSRNRVGYWTIPGGKIEFGERLSDAVIREVQEELGVHLEIKKLLQVCDDLIPEEKQHWVSVLFLCKCYGVPSNKEPAKCEIVQWFDLNMLPSLLTTPTQTAIDAYLLQN